MDVNAPYDKLTWISRKNLIRPNMVLFVIGVDWFLIDSISILNIVSLNIGRRSNTNQNWLSVIDKWDGDIHVCGIMSSFEVFDLWDSISERW